MTNSRLLFAGDHRFFRDGVRAALQAVDGFEFVGEAATGEEVIERAVALPPGVNGIEATRHIVQASPRTGVIVVTMFGDTDSVLAARRAGARGYSLKGAGEEELIRSIRAVYNGEALLGPEVAQRLLNYLVDVTPRASSTAFPELTEREREVLPLIAQGLSNQQIADRLDTSLKTARNHVSNILNKLQVTDRTVAANRARVAGLGRDSA